MDSQSSNRSKKPPAFLDEALAVQAVNNPGYHTRLPVGGTARHTRENARLAQRLLGSASAADQARARRILTALLAVQDTDPASPTYGTWPWYFEEPLADMVPPDLNWADFIGGILLTIIARQGERLDASLAAGLREALRHAAHCIRRRNVGPHYTNIAIMGATVTAGAGEQLGDSSLLDYGRQRLTRFAAHTRAQGGFNEYNSPNYTWVALHEVERTLATVNDPVMRHCATALHEEIWSAISPFFHPGTQQWAGPHSRAYHDHLTPEVVAGLNRRLGLALRSREDRPPRPVNEDSFALPSPAQLRDRFERLPTPVCQHEQTFIRRADGSAAVTGKVWMDTTACLGTVNVDSLWVQRRPLLGYWRTSDDPAVVLRVRCLRDGRDWASAALHTRQAGHFALAALGTLSDAGDFHLMLDRPADGRFPTCELVFVCSLTGRGTVGVQLSEDLWELSAGDNVALIRTAPAQLAGQTVSWSLSADEAGIRLHATARLGSAAALDPRTLAPHAAIAIALGPRHGITPPPPLVGAVLSAGLSWTCGDLQLVVPAAPPGYSFR